MEALGRTINVVQTAAGAWISVKDCDAITFVCNNSSAETYTLTEAKDASGTSSQSPTASILTTYYTGKVDGTAKWTKRTQSAANNVVNVGNAANAVTVFAVDVHALDAGFPYVKVAANNSGTVFAILHDLDVQRAPAALNAPGV